MEDFAKEETTNRLNIELRNQEGKTMRVSESTREPLTQELMLHVKVRLLASSYVCSRYCCASFLAAAFTPDIQCVHAIHLPPLHLTTTLSFVFLAKGQLALKRGKEKDVTNEVAQKEALLFLRAAEEAYRRADPDILDSGVIGIRIYGQPLHVDGYFVSLVLYLIHCWQEPSYSPIHVIRSEVPAPLLIDGYPHHINVIVYLNDHTQPGGL